MEKKVDTRQARMCHREPLLCASDRYFFGCMGAYVIAATVASLTGIAPMEAVSCLWVGALVAPFVIPPFGRSLDLRK